MGTKPAAILALVVCGIAAAQSTTPVPLPAVPLGPNDLVSVNVYGVAAFTRTIRIGRDGTLQIPMIDQPLVAAGKLPSDLELDIAAALRRNELVLNPVVTVTVAEYVSRQVTVAGAVKSPGTIQAVTRLRLLDAIAKAGGLADDAGPEVLLQSTTENGSDPVRRIAVKDLLDKPEGGSDDKSNPILSPGDEIRVPRAPRIFVLGNVRKQGAISLVDTSGSSVLKAIALAEGLAPFANNDAWILRPTPGSAEREQIPVPLAKIMNRKSPDVELKPEDIFYVPDNKTKRLSADVINRLAGFGSATASGVLIWK